MQFLLEWPAGPQVYRISGTGANSFGTGQRTVPFIGNEPELVKEAPAAFGLGPPGEVMVTQSATGVSGLAQLNLYNAHDVYALVNIVLLLYVIGEPNTPPTSLPIFTVVPPHQNVFIYDLLTSQMSYQIQTLQAEDDPPMGVVF
jgi:hypothetical protein